MTNEPLIAIYGGGFINKGAEAMVRVVQAELSRRLPGLGYRFAIEGIPDEHDLIEADGSVRLHRDERSYQERWDLPWKRGALRRSEDIAGRYKGITALINISGYAFGGNKCAKRILRFTAAAEAVNGQGGYVVAMPQAWGPFTNFLDRRAMQRLLGAIDEAYTRDDHSHHELMALPNPSRTRVSQCRDIAVCLTPVGTDRTAALLGELGMGLDANIIAICPNMRVYDRTDGDGSANVYLRMLVEIAEELSRETGCRLLLLPHEIRFDGDPVKDDRFLCLKLAEELNSKGIHAAAPQQRYSAEELKGLLGACGAVVGSRYHSLVASLTQGVPAVAIGWSHKYQGLFSDFGCSESVFDYHTVGVSDVTGAVGRLLDDRASQSARLLKVAAEQKQEVGGLFDHLAEALRSRLAPVSKASNAA